jgi:hypothetical protein
MVAGGHEWLRVVADDLTLWHFFGAFVLMRLAFEFLKPFILAPDDPMAQPDW